MVWQSVIKFFKAVGEFYVKYKAYIDAAVTAYTVYTGVKGYQQARDMLAKGQSIMANKTAAGGKIPVIYGTRRVGTQIVYMDTFGNDNRDLYVVYALAVGECEEILGRTIEIDGNSILDAKIFKKGGYIGSDKISSGAGSLCTADQGGDVNAGVGGGIGTDPTKRYQFVFNLHHGADSQTADPMLRASIPNAWSTNHKLNGICYIAAHFHYSKTGVFQGVPQITVQVKGKKVYDPRESGHTFGDPSTYEWSSNPALCYLDYITNDSYGKGLAESDINMSTFESAADVCDVEVDQPYYNGAYQNVTWSGTSGDDFIVISDNDDWYQNKTDEIFDLRDNGGTNVFTGAGITGVQRHQFYDDDQVNKIFINETLTSTYTNEAGSARAKVKRFHCNGYIDINKNVMDNAKELLANMRGIFTYINGKYELQIEDTGSSTFSITDDHIISDTGISVDYGSKDKKANKVIVEFFNSQQNYELDTVTVLHDATPEYYSDDGEILEVKAEFPLITDAYIAHNMGKAILTRSRNQMTMQFLGTPEMYKLNVGDIVDLTYAGLGFSGKICRVEALELQPNGLVSVSLIEYFDVYTWEVPAQEDARKLLKIPTRGAIHPPESTSIVFTDTDASAISRPTLTWTEPTDFDVKEFRVDVVDSSDNNVFSKIVDTPSVDLSFLPKASDYEASITSFNTLGVESEPITKTFTIADDPVKTTEVEIDGVTLSTVEAYGTVSGKSGNWLKFLNKANFAEIVEYDNGFIVNGGTGQFENAAIFVDGATSRGELFIDDGHIRFDSNTPSDTTNKLYNVAGTLYWNGNSINTAAGDITAVVAGTNLNGGGTSGSVTLNLDSTISGDHTFSNNVIISGNLTVNGTTTTVHTDNLNVKDNNITLNYSTGDSSATADGAGITIQDAVNSTTDATILWTTANDTFNFSHPVSVTGNITSSNTVTSQAINVSSSGYGVIEVGGVSGAYIDLKRPNTDDYDLRLITTGTGGQINAPTGATIDLQINTADILSVSSTGIDVTGNIVVSGTVDGRDVATDGSKLDGIEAGATTDQTQAEINALGITAIGLSGTPNITVGTISSGFIHANAGTGNIAAKFESTDAGSFINLVDNSSGTFGALIGAEGDDIVFSPNNVEALRIDSSQNATFTGTISSGAITSTGSSSFEEINFGDNEKAQFGASNDLQIYHNGSNSYIDEVGTGGLIIRAGGTMQLNSPIDEKMIRMVANGAVTLYHNNIAKIATTSSGVDITGTIHATGDISTDSDLQVDNNAQIDGNCDIGTSSSNTLTINATIDNPLYIEDAKTSSTGHLLKLKDTSATDVMGTYISFAYDGSSGEIESGIIGSIEGAPNAPKFYVSNSGNVGLSFFGFTGVTAISPCNDDGSSRDNAIDLGTSSARFDDIYATNGTIQTSDRNEKQDIQELSDAEQRVAVACKGLIRRYKFNSAVEQKGDEARYHFGIIAQDLQDAFESEGLDAGDYGVFIQETWTDEEGNEQTRLGVRYNELLAFIIATL